ncbi:MAG: hypothetical protein NTW45_01380 [Rhodocyclales bacterium]|nr:hypothetical protein [Rhodocyclales bacterium]
MEDWASRRKCRWAAPSRPWLQQAATKKYRLPGIQNTATAVFPLSPMPNMFSIGDSLFTCVPAPAETFLGKAQIMIGQGGVAMQQDGLKTDMFHAAASLVHADECGSLILDGMGRIRSCGAAGERILGASQVGLIGRPISDCIAGLHLGGSSPSYAARYLVYLCGEGEWRRFEAIDAGGQRFAVELSLSRLMRGGQETFLLNIKRPGTANGE